MEAAARRAGDGVISLAAVRFRERLAAGYDLRRGSLILGRRAAVRLAGRAGGVPVASPAAAPAERKAA